MMRPGECPYCGQIGCKHQALTLAYMESLRVPENKIKRKIYVFGRDQIVLVHSDSEQEARMQLVDQGLDQDEFELRDVRDEE